jgi:hypothetical protein
MGQLTASELRSLGLRDEPFDGEFRTLSPILAALAGILEPGSRANRLQSPEKHHKELRGRVVGRGENRCRRIQRRRKDGRWMLPSPSPRLPILQLSLLVSS